MNKILIVGNPNTGKTTLFNTLTKSNEKTANYSGVTVESKSKTITLKNQNVEVVDLPGIYSLSLCGQDERVTLDYLNKNSDAEIVYVCSSCDIKRNLILFNDLVNRGYKVKIVINKIGKKLNDETVDELKNTLNIPIIQQDVRKNIDTLIDFILEPIDKKITKKIQDFKSILTILGVDDQNIQSMDKILLHPFFGKIIFFIVFSLVIYISYGPIGSFLSSWLEEKLFFYCGNIIQNIKSSSWIIDFCYDVIFKSVFSLIVYLPQLTIMLSIMYLLEEVGYLPRVAYLFNLPLEKCGMNGKSVFSLMVGVGCTTSAVLVTRNIDSCVAKQNTARFLPFIGCSAKLPLFLLISSLCFNNVSVLVVIGIYLLSILIGITYIKLYSNTAVEPFLCELPKLRIPPIISIVKKSIIIAFDFLKRVLLSVFVVATVVWLFMNIKVDFKFMSDNVSILEYIVDKISFLFKPIGLDNVMIIISLIVGIIAKENIISTIGLLGGVGTLSTTKIFSFLIFVMLYTPCIPTLKCLKKEVGTKVMTKIALGQFVIAYIASYVFYSFSKISIIAGFVMVGVCCLFIMLLRYFENKEVKCDFGCKSCVEKYNH